MGWEGSGIVDSVGKNITDIRPGQRVAFMCYPYGGSWATYARTTRSWVVPIPERVKMEHAAQLQINPVTMCEFFTLAFSCVICGDMSSC